MVNEIEERKQKLKNFFKEKYNLLVYVALALVVFIATYIRTRNLQGLRDVTTGGWTLAQDLDPYLFLRWAKEIIEHGTLPVIDAMRYVPIGFDTISELVLQSYLIAWFHKIAVFFGSTSVEQSAAIYPVFMFALTVIAFFLLVRKIFIDNMGETKAGIIALISSLFLSIIPSLLPRTIAGIPEKEASGFLFMFLAFYFFLDSWKSNKVSGRIIFSLLAGISTALMALVWGGVIYIFLVISLSAFLALILGKADRNKLLIYAIWVISSFTIMNIYSTRYPFSTLIGSTTTLIPLVVLGFLVVHVILTETKIKEYLQYEVIKKLPEPLITILVTSVLGAIFVTLLFGVSYIPDKFSDITRPLIVPVTDRLGVTVAENRQPFFSEWANNFGPVFSNIPIFFWIFFFGSIYLYSFLTRVLNKKDRIIATLGYSFFLFALVFSRYSSSSILNGTNIQSLSLYVLGVILLAYSLARPGMISSQKAKEYYNWTIFSIIGLGFLGVLSSSLFNLFIYKLILGILVLFFGVLSVYGISKQELLKKVDFSLILIFSLFFLSIISARGSVRTIMVLVPAASITSAYLLVSLFDDSRKIGENYKLFVWIIGAIISLGLLISGFQFYQQSIYLGENNVKVPLPNGQMTLDIVYAQQWQKAMGWVRNNTINEAVFAHWWDYGYWVQSLGERATVLDGGNAYAYWDYLMGRYALTGKSNQEALEFLYSHNVTHFLIDSTDIGKYTAFSSIGSDENYDRFSSIQTFSRADQETVETKNSVKTIYYPGQKGTIIPLESDLTYTINETKIFLPAGKSGVIAIIIEKNSSGLMQPYGIFYYQGNQYLLPLRYGYSSSLTDFNSGVQSGIFLFPIATQTSVINDGALLYLSERTVNSQLARLYLFGEKNSYFRLVHSQDNEIVERIKASGASNSDFVYFGGLQGPIKIWQVSYPQGIQVNPDYLKPSYPNPNLSIAK